jgi:hypothetical protein
VPPVTCELVPSVYTSLRLADACSSGGTIVERLIADTKLMSSLKVFALVRKPEQAEAVKERGLHPLFFDKDSPEEVKKALLDNESKAPLLSCAASLLRRGVAHVRLRSHRGHPPGGRFPPPHSRQLYRGPRCGQAQARARDSGALHVCESSLALCDEASFS